MAEIVTVRHRSGAEITLCMAHRSECCGICCMDFQDMNQMAIEDAKNSKASGGTKKHLGKLPVGTRVMMRDRSGRVPPSDLYGVITGSRIAKCDVGTKIPHYVIKFDDGDTECVPVEDVEDEWQVVQAAP